MLLPREDKPIVEEGVEPAAAVVAHAVKEIADRHGVPLHVRAERLAESLGAGRR